MSNSRLGLDENVVCPITGADLILEGDGLTTADGGHRYAISDGIPRLFVDPTRSAHVAVSETTKKVQDFYEDAPFPNYGEFDDIRVFIERAEKGFFARSLSEQIPANSTVLEVGCGTGQLSNYLAATTNSRVYATDVTLASLRLGLDFATKNEIDGVGFIHMNLFHPCIRPESMDVVISNGVLHHTADPHAAFLSIAPLVKPGGYILIGLYNRIGRLRTDLRRQLYRLLGERILFLDPRIRKDLPPEKRRAWIRDQYCHPRESKHSISEVLGWFDEARVAFVSSRPKIIGTRSPIDKIFEARPPGSRLWRTATEIEMLFSHYGSAGGLFLMIGRKK